MTDRMTARASKVISIPPYWEDAKSDLMKRDRVLKKLIPKFGDMQLQGRSDPFGMPGGAPGREVVAVEGSHSLRKGEGVIEAAVATWLRSLKGPR